MCKNSLKIFGKTKSKKPASNIPVIFQFSNNKKKFDFGKIKPFFNLIKVDQKFLILN